MSACAIKREPARVAVAYRQRRVFAEGLAFSLAAERLMPVLRRAARVISRGDYQLAQDMEQEALIDLWDYDISRFDAESEEALKKVLADRMRLVRRRERLDSMATTRADTDPDDVTEEGEEQRSVRIRRAQERFR
jgi:hypothetical protein